MKPIERNRIYLILIVLFVTFQGCSESTSENYEFLEENPFPEYLQQTGFDEVTISYIDDNSYYEIGTKFVPLVNGKITSLEVKVPDEVTNLRITIWNSQQSLPVQTLFIDVLRPNVLNNYEIQDIPLIAGTEYAITMSSADYYFHKQENGGAVAHPLTIGNISIIGGVSNYGQSQTLGETYSENSLFGDCFFNFQQTD